LKKEYTHAKGFNVTSLKEVAGLYFFHNIKGEVEYIGKCNNDFKNRINSHGYGLHGKLSPETVYLRVIIADPINYPLHVLENFFIWYFGSQKNKSLWLFSGVENEKGLKKIAKSHNLYIRGSLEKFILSFESVLIKREWDENNKNIRYGEIEQLSSREIFCDSTQSCLCYRCLVIAERKNKGILYL